jgi:hypothetical protein
VRQQFLEIGQSKGRSRDVNLCVHQRLRDHKRLTLDDAETEVPARVND